MDEKKPLGVSTIEDNWEFELPEEVRAELAKQAGRPLRDGDKIEFLIDADGQLVIRPG